MKTEIDKLQQWVHSSDNIVFFGGAGVSTESGIPDFRSEDGLYSQEYEYPPEIMLSYSFFMDYPEEFYRFYKNKLLTEGIKPNQSHIVLAELEKAGKLRAVITQNIDCLHQMAGSQNVIELHGSTSRNYCMDCTKPHKIESIKNVEIPTCECGGIIRPDVVLYEESLETDLLIQAADYISQADMLIIGGTSLSVYPAAGLIYYYEGNKLVLINNSETDFDKRANLVIRQRIGSVFDEIWSSPNRTL